MGRLGSELDCKIGRWVYKLGDRSSKWENEKQSKSMGVLYSYMSVW
jgi:hypothetical protein